MKSTKDIILFLWKAIFSFKWRLSRIDYLASFIVYLLIFGLLSQIDLHNTILNLLFSFIYTIFALVWIVALMTKRLHDISLSGKWLFLFYWCAVIIFTVISYPSFQEHEFIWRIIVMSIYILALLIFMIYPGVSWVNKYWKNGSLIFYKKSND